jgi:CBS domain-containing protein
MRAKDVMTIKIVRISPDNSVRQAAKMMLDNQVSGIPVVDDDGHLLGIISEGDLIRRTELGSDATLAEKAMPAKDKSQRLRQTQLVEGRRRDDERTRDH